MTIMKKSVLLLILLFSVTGFTLNAQDDNLTFKGKVTDKAGNPVSDVAVSVLDEFTQVSTDNSGAFSIKTSMGKTLYFSKKGYVHQKKEIANRENIIVTLDKEFAELKINVAYGTRSRSELTSAVSNLFEGNQPTTSVSTLGNAIQGLGTGLTSLHNVGAEPGWDQPSLYIRGVQTFGSGTSPLVMVDNVERDFSQLDPEEIESMTILKDAAAVALYGMRGANGVINVTTKKGFMGKPVISLMAQYGIQSPTRLPNYIGSKDYVKYRNIALRNDYYKLSDSEFNNLFLSDPRNNPDNYNGSNPYLYANTDWYDQFLKNTAPQQMYRLSFRGGTEIAQYYLLLGIVDQQGLYNHTEENKGFSTQQSFSRYNFRSNIDVNISPILKVGVNLGGRVENRHYPNTSSSSIITALSKLPPTMPYLNENSSISGSSQFQYNPYGMIANTGFADRYNRYIQGTTTADLKLDMITKGLSANVLFGFDSYKFYGRSKDQKYAVYQQNQDGTYTQFGEGSSLSLKYSGWGTDYSLMLNYMGGLAYDRTFGIHKVAADLKYMQSSRSVDGNNPDYKNQGLFGRATYTYDGKYTAEFGYAYNGSENFAKGSRFGFFPVLSGAWVISKEDFMKNNSVLNYLKLRGSFGIVGNSDIGVGSRFPYEENFYTGNGYYFGTANSYGAYEGRIPNSNITWEESLNANIGLEMDILKKLSIEADLFRHDRSNIITERSNILPSIIGQSLPYTNGGSVLSTGFEISLSHNNRIGNLGYSVQANVSYAKNKITDKEEVGGLNSWEYRANRAVMQQWGLQVSPDKFFKDEADIASWAKSTYGAVRPGDVKYVDQNNDNVIDGQDYVPLGNPSVPEWNFGLNLGCDYKGFDFKVLFSGIANRSLFISNSVLWGMQDNNKVTAEVAENSWGISNNPLYPRLTTQLNNNNYQPSSLWLRNVGYLRIQTMELGYSFPKRLLAKANISDVRFFINGYNLLSFDGLKKLNLSAEIPNAGVTLYPETRVINIGASLKF